LRSVWYGVSIDKVTVSTLLIDNASVAICFPITLFLIAVATVVSLSHAVVRCALGQRGLGACRGGAVQRGGEAKDKSPGEAHAAFIVTHTTRDCGAVVKHWPAGRGETGEGGETYFGCSAVEPSGITFGTTYGTTHVQGTRDCGVITSDNIAGSTHVLGTRDCGGSTAF
jgi:hypothetical protein